MQVETAYADAYGYPLDYRTTENLAAALGAQFELTRAGAAAILLNAAISLDVPAQGADPAVYLIRHTVVQGSIPKGLYAWRTRIEFGAQRIYLAPLVLRVI